jgi:dipeptidyl aminopeptidase/acylaminoacyl peptidase
VTVRVRVLAAALLVAAAISQPAGAANRYDPRFHFRTIATPRFNIYFHQGEEAIAHRLAAIAEDVAQKVEPQLGTPNGRVHVILVDQNDVSNGWATPVPYNIIEITAAAPPGESTIGNTDDWLRLVFSHEYTHIVHLDKAHGWIGGLRRVFGRSPVLYPNVFLPLWQIEGIATYNESVLTGAGRVPAGDFRQIVDRAGAARRFEPLDRASGGLVAWPSGTAQYAYGAYFHQYLAQRFGPDSIARLADETAGRLPYFGVRGFRKVFGRSLGNLWDDFEADTRQRLRNESSPPVRLTHHGFTVAPPAFARSGRLFYSVANPHGFPSLMEIRRDGGQPRRVADRFLGSRIGIAGDRLVFDQLDYVNQVALRSDLYSVSENGGPVQRLTENARAVDPDVSPDGRTIVCTIQSADRRALATMPVPASGEMASPVLLTEDASVDYSSPRWSPDGRSIAVERRRVGGPSEIVIINRDTREARVVVSSTDARNVTPAWLSNATILFASDRGGGPFAIYAVELASGAMRKLEGAGLSAQSPAVSPDGTELVFVGYTADGYDLFALPLASATWIPLKPDSSQPARPVTASAASSTVRDTTYQPWRTLAPQFWSPIVESDSGEISGGAETAGMDALGRHAYAGAVAWTTSRARPDWSLNYAYDRWWPTLFVNLADDTDPWRQGEVRTREVNLGALLVARRVRHSQSVLAAFNASSDAFACDACATPVHTLIPRRAIRVGWSFDATRSYGYSVSRESGTAVQATWEVAPEGLGSEASSSAVTMTARSYHPAGPRHAVIALRAAAASAWGDEQARRAFIAAGPGPQPGGFDFGSDAIGLIRGLDSDAVVGDHAAVVNADYRFPLWTLERGVGTVPVFFRTIHAAVFADAGHAWTGAFRSADIRVAAGFELSLDAVLGYTLPVTFATGVAWRDDPVSARRGAAAFGRIGRAF